MNVGESVSREFAQSSLSVSGNLNRTNEVVTASENDFKGTALTEVRVNIDSERRVKGIEIEDLDEVVDSLNKNVKPINTKLQFSVHEKTRQILVKIVDNDTDEIVKEIPPEKLLDIKANLLEAAGILIDSKA